MDSDSDHKGGLRAFLKIQWGQINHVPFYTVQPHVKHLLKMLNIHLQKLSLRMGSHGDKPSSDTQKNKNYATEHSPDFKCITEVTI